MESVVTRFSGMDCMDLCIIHLVNGCEKNMNYLFSDSYGFEFLNSSEYKKIGSGVNNARGNRFKLIDDLLDIKCRQYINKDLNKKQLSKLSPINETFHSSEELMNIGKDLTKKKELLAHIDPYFCHWDRGYKLYRGSHACILTSIERDYVVINDVWHEKKNIKMPIKEFLKGIHRLTILDVNESPSIIDNNKLIKRICIKNKDIKSKIKLFNSSLMKADLLIEYEGCDENTIMESTIDSRIKRIIEGRRQYCIFLKSTGNRFDKEIELLEQLAEGWFDIKMNLAHSYLKLKNGKDIKEIMEKISNQLDELLLSEGGFIEGLEFKLSEYR